ncbi:vWA domain-containing protein [Pseudoblastomonas halimionae]|uniref:DUF3520 domain-containing protein n=1 Tax=Alteriqipengyuania halimionae TaxID=1926630 RepID=A0A6I4U0B7_9SPHN|nr:von Willebrand factor type A domain-containing protein [Alteriqipengyuania halimionae]MXP08664.1 DUF3520 domain-containing protein [Alteriqipengyuania halimionae]
MTRLAKYAMTGVAVALLAGCATSGDTIDTTGASTSDSGEVAPSPPPPPPPPPPPARMAAPTTLATSVPPVIVPTDPGREQYDGKEVSPVKRVADEPVSTFSVDVDTGAYANMRRFLRDGQRPPEAAVRTEEFINYFRYDYGKPQDRSTPFSVATDVGVTPWNRDTRLLRIGLQGYDIPREERPAANLVFLLDVSGSMGSPDKLPLLQTALKGLVDNLGEEDLVSIVVYAGAAGLVLQPTNDAGEIKRALDMLSAGGSTAGGAGLQLAYQIARDNFIEGGVNRVIIGTDGDFNVGITGDSLIERIEKERDTGVTLSVLGFGTGNYNEAVMEQVANKGNGNYSYIDSALEARKVLGEEMSSTLFTIAKDVKIQIEFNPKYVKQYRLIGYENRALREQDFENDKVDAGEIGASHQVTALYEIVPADKDGWIAERRYDGNRAPSASGSGSEMAYIKLRYKLPDGDESTLVERAVPASMLAAAKPLRGDFAFVAGVAAFGQYLRGDDLLGDFGPDRIASLVGPQNDYYRAEFVKLVEASTATE